MRALMWAVRRKDTCVKVWPLSIILWAMSTAGFACMPMPRPGNYDLFWPSRSPVQVDDKFPRLPAVTLERVDFIRAREPRPNDCSESGGMLEVTLLWPAHRAFPLDHMGFYFRVTSGNSPRGLFPREPIAVVRASGNRAKLLFRWDDEPPSRQKSMSFTFEVIPVDAWLHLGPSTSRTVP
jgi:hypothetical protein